MLCSNEANWGEAHSPTWRVAGFAVCIEANTPPSRRSASRPGIRDGATRADGVSTSNRCAHCRTDLVRREGMSEVRRNQAESPRQLVLAMPHGGDGVRLGRPQSMRFSWLAHADARRLSGSVAATAARAGGGIRWHDDRRLGSPPVPNRSAGGVVRNGGRARTFTGRSSAPSVTAKSVPHGSTAWNLSRYARVRVR